MEKSQNPRSIRARKSLREAILILIEDRSLDMIKISEITDTAGLYRMTFYNHYETKEELLNDAIRDKLIYVLGEIPDLTGVNWIAADGLEKIPEDHTYLVYDKWVEEKIFLELIFRLELDYLLIQHHIEYNRQFIEYLRRAEGFEISSELCEYLITSSAYVLVSMLRVWIEGGTKETTGVLSELFYTLGWVPTGKAAEEFRDKI